MERPFPARPCTLSIHDTSKLNRRGNRRLPVSAGVGLLLLVFCFCVTGPLAAADESIPIDLQLQIFLKIMTYNRSISFDKLNAFVVTIAFDKTQSRHSTESIAAQLKEVVTGKTILGRPITLNVVGISKSFKPESIGDCHLLILYGGLNDVKYPLLLWAHEHKILSATAADDIEDSEVVVLLRLEDKKPVIHFNLPLARKLGFDFHAQFLKHCVITK